jgi:Rad3-related DNA helicase
LQTATSDRLVQIQPAPTKDNATGIMGFFPWKYHRKPLPNQIQALAILEKENSIVLEAPTGSGKTAIGYSFLKYYESRIKEGGCRYIVPNKTLVNQIKEMYPDIGIAYGRNEHECLYYEDRPRADMIPCSMLEDCDHRVDQTTGETKIGGATPCPYLLQKYEFMKNRVGVCTMAFELYTGPAFSNEREPAAALVIDEVHNLADVVRRSLSYSITDQHLEQVIEMLESIDAYEEVNVITRFYKSMIKIVKRRVSGRATLLEDREVEELISTLDNINTTEMKKKIAAAVKERKIDTIARREILKRVETITRDLRRYLHSLVYSLPTERRKASNYTYAYYMYEKMDDGSEKMQYRLVIQAYSVGGMVKRMLSPHTLSMSATIGDPKVFSYESGIDHPFHSLASEFPAENTRIFMPSDTPNLAVKFRNKGEPARVLRKMAQACKAFNKHGHRCLVVVVSNLERQKFMKLCEEEKVDAISYGNGVKPKEAAEKFMDGEGDNLVGTAANYSEGVDLHSQNAPIILVLRPSYASPDDPLTQFEDRRFPGGHCWALRNWRVMQEALQVRGRNIRSKKCLGVTIFFSQQFRRFLFHALPEYLKPSYRSEITLEQCVKETLKLLK